MTGEYSSVERQHGRVPLLRYGRWDLGNLASALNPPPPMLIPNHLLEHYRIGVPEYRNALESQ
jgi:hypothetical protein